VFLNRTVTLPSVITDALANGHLTPNMQEFDGRLNDKSLHGRFMTASDLQKHSGKPISDVIRDMTVGKSRGCNVPIMFYIDGMRAGPDPDTLSKTATDYQGIEFYTPGAAPLRFNATADATPSSMGAMQASKTQPAGSVFGGSSASIRAASACGVVLLWQRERP
jgi:hypothetical protein